MTTVLADELPVKRFFELINLGNSTAAEAQNIAFEDEIADLGETDETGDESDDESEIIWVIKDVIDWESGFFVDWKDAESFISSIETLADRVDISLDWGVDDTDDDDFLEKTSVPDLMVSAYEQLQTHGYTLWNWDTAADCYGGWITRSTDDEEMLNIAEALGIKIRTADIPF